MVKIVASISRGARTSKGGSSTRSARSFADGKEPGAERGRIHEGLCRFAGGKGMMGEGSQRGCCSRHEAARLFGQREENPQPLPAPLERPASRKAGGDSFRAPGLKQNGGGVFGVRFLA